MQCLYIFLTLPLNIQKSTTMKSIILPLIVSGLLLLLFGIIAVTAPNMTVQTLMIYLAFMLAAVGALSIIISFLMNKQSSGWWIPSVFGVLACVLAYIIFTNDNASAHYFTIFIASWAGLMGIGLIAASFFQKPLRIILIVNGLMSAGFGAVIYFNPFTGTNTMNFMVGFYTILLSVMMLYAAYYVSRIAKNKSKSAEIQKQ